MHSAKVPSQPISNCIVDNNLLLYSHYTTKDIIGQSHHDWSRVRKADLVFL
jgi:hypothetical protein